MLSSDKVSLLVPSEMLNFHLYRLAFIPALLAAVIGAFSLGGIPSPLGTGATTQVFDDAGAISTAHKLIRIAPDRAPGSDGDKAAADYVEQRFKTITAGTVGTQTFDGPGDTGTLENVLVTLPGNSEKTIVLLAGRDSDRVPGAASSAAATALLIEVAEELGGSEHSATLILVSVDGSTDGSAGTRQLFAGLADRNSIAAVINISQPGAKERKQPLLVSSSAGASSPSAQLVETAAALLGTEGRGETTREGALGDLARLAFPTGLGEQAPLIADGFDAITLTSAGEPPLPPSSDGEDALGKESLADVGRAAIALVGAIDQSDSLEHGPRAYVNFAGNLVPGWSLALLALALLIPPLAVGAEEIARQSRRAQGLRALGAWAARVALPPLAALGSIYALALLGVVPSPPFPFDPGPIGIGAAELLALVFFVVLVGGVAYLERIWQTPNDCPRQALAAVGGLLGVLGCVVAWVANPYLALLLAPIAHVWIAACRREQSRGFTLVIAAVTSIPILAAIVATASALDWGLSTPWQLVLLVADGQIGLAASLAFALAWASVTAALFAAAAPPAAPTPTRERPLPELSSDSPAMQPPVGTRG
ncbi:hypothetical protein BH10ACT11_BH10ACT11_03240 [soil metagenome]